MKKTTDICEKIAVRAYYAWLNGSTASAEAMWLKAELIELAYAERRTAAARKAAETRKVKAVPQIPAVAVVAKRRPSARRSVEHRRGRKGVALGQLQ